MNQSVTNIFEYSNIRIYWSRIYIRTFVRINFSFTNIFGHSFVLNLFVRIYSDIRSLVCQSVKTKQMFECIQIFVLCQKNIRIYPVIHWLFMQICSDVHLCRNFHKCDTLMQTRLTSCISYILLLLFSLSNHAWSWNSKHAFVAFEFVDS